MAVKKLVGAAALILDQAGRVLLLKHTYGKLHWDLPGGGAEANESAAETALREVREFWLPRQASILTRLSRPSRVHLTDAMFT